MEQYAAQGYFNKDSIVVVIFPDHGSRYMSKIYSEDWMNDQGFLDKKTQAQETPINYIK
jgi:cystathionine beta-synthase